MALARFLSEASYLQRWLLSSGVVLQQLAACLGFIPSFPFAAVGLLGNGCHMIVACIAASKDTEHTTITCKSCNCLGLRSDLEKCLCMFRVLVLPFATQPLPRCPRPCPAPLRSSAAPLHISSILRHVWGPRAGPYAAYVVVL